MPILRQLEMPTPFVFNCFQIPKDVEELWDIQSWLSSKLNELWKYKQKQHKSLSEFDLGKLHYEKEPHISLSKVGVTLQYHWINSFTSSIKSAFLRMKRFYVSFCDVKVLLNESNTRVFIGNKLSISFGPQLITAIKLFNQAFLIIVQFDFFTLLGLEASAEQLQEHVNLIDNILKEFGQPEFYKDPKFHVSLIWCLPITENLSGVGISKESATINLEKQLKECIEEINRDLKAAYQTGEVCNSKYYHYPFKSS